MRQTAEQEDAGDALQRAWS